MQAGRFIPYGADHLIVIACLLAGAAVLIASRAWLQRQDALLLRRMLAVLLLGQGVGAWSLAWARGSRYVPFQLCDLTLVLAAFALWRPAPLVSELVYFWGLAGSVQALATPALEAPFPSSAWLTFFLSHGGVILTALYLAASGKVRPTPAGILRAWLLIHVYAAAAGIVNWLAGTNYGYLAHKPSQPSLLDHLGPWPVYIAAMDVIALVSSLLCYAPYALNTTRRER